MILKTLLQQLFEELRLGSVPPEEEDKSHHFKINSLEIVMKDLDPGFYFASEIGPLPKKKKEDFLMLLMKANFLGQGTGGSTLGLKEDESCLTLSLSLPYEMNYKAFKDSLEDFTNFVEFWKKETVRFAAEAEKN